MGSSQSQPSEAPSQTTPQVVRINREEIPEEYKAVGVSGAVINRVNAHVRTGAPAGAGIAADIDVEKLRAELERERGEKVRLRNEVSEMRQLTDLQQRVKTENSGAVVLGGDVEERKRIFDETVERVEKQFFNYRRENVCADNETEIMSCLKANPNRLLKCSNLVGSYEQCVGNFRQEVLKGN
ncbi:unnamed protein product, partial [Mesorhabditis belari]|uniref:MICOS complex subunit MIC19 n=1 Tax=Mesorhabditis belari TaxID=2138241 RepID=A0AAF3EFB0_9BILA